MTRGAVPRYYLETFGCQMNVHDSDRMGEVLRAHGWTAVNSPDDAELVIFNTCSVREKAEQKLRSEVGKLAPLKASRPDLVIAVAGCVAQQEGEKLLKRVSHLDIVIGPDNIPELPRLVQDQLAGAPPRARTEFDLVETSFLSASPDGGGKTSSAMVTTMKGCDERCSFCIVPYTRGPERYRPVADIVNEVAKWVASGAQEVLLLGQTVDSYRDASLPPPASDDPDESQFPSLLRIIANEVPGLKRLRYTSPHPRHATAALANAHAEVGILAHHIHLPVQSGSNRMLKRMIRRYTREEFVVRARRLLAAQPDMTMSTDIIVGFPGETDEDFEATLSLVQEVGFTALFGFKYSPRPYTPALRLEDDVPEEVKSERLARLFAAIELQGGAHLTNLIGRQEEVLFEGVSKTDKNVGMNRRFQGRTFRNEIVHALVPSEFDLTNVIATATITRANKHSLEGDLDPRAFPSLPRATRSTSRSLPLVSGSV
jgi:tRNA-2-methylthio-N6-dimethylallyladenosine synthase